LDEAPGARLNFRADAAAVTDFAEKINAQTAITVSPIVARDFQIT
jgi:hypothetical protein